MKKWVMLFLLCSLSLSAKNMAKPTPIPKVKTEVTFSPNTFRVDFNQEFISVTGKAKSSKGSIEYSYPGQIRLKEFKDNSEFVTNGKNSWYYVPPFVKGEKGTVQINQDSSMVLGKVFDSLHAGLKSNEHFGVEWKDKQAKLLFSEKGKKNWKLAEATINFNATSKDLVMAQMEKLDLVYTDKKKVSLTFFNFSSDIKYPKDYFTFQIPKDTQIVK